MSKKTDLISKYATKTEAEMLQEQDEIQSEYAIRCEELDQKIRDFSSQIDPLKVNGETLAEVRRPTRTQFAKMVPPELAKYRDHPEEIPIEVAAKYENDMYDLMAELIVNPKHDADWWKGNTGDDWMAAFQAHLMKLRENMDETIKSFL